MDTSVAVFYLPNSLRTELFRKAKKGKEKRVRKGRKEKGKEEKGRGRKGKERGKEKQSILNFKLIDPSNYLPKESMLKMTLSVFGFAPADLFEVCVRLKQSRMFSRPFCSTS